MAFNPYLFFSDGTCREAMTRYQEVLGGQLDVMVNGEAPPDARMPGGDDLVMHSALVVDDDVLMASDDPTGDGGPRLGAAVHWTAPDVETAERVFAGLAEGGEVQMDIGEVFWADRYGYCIDRFGTHWMVSAGMRPG